MACINEFRQIDQMDGLCTFLAFVLHEHESRSSFRTKGLSQSRAKVSEPMISGVLSMTLSHKSGAGFIL